MADKCDLPYNVEDSYLDNVAAQVGAIQWFKTSAVTGENVQELSSLSQKKCLKITKLH